MLIIHITYQANPHDHVIITNPNDKGVYVFDQMNAKLMHCDTTDGCVHLVLPGQETENVAEEHTAHITEKHTNTDATEKKHTAQTSHTTTKTQPKPAQHVAEHEDNQPVNDAAPDAHPADDESHIQELNP